jgi:hypothetical protein
MEGGLEPMIISMPIVIGTVPLQRTFKCLQKPDPLLTGSPLSRMTNLKYKGFREYIIKLTFNKLICSNFI